MKLRYEFYLSRNSDNKERKKERKKERQTDRQTDRQKQRFPSVTYLATIHAGSGLQ
jgi:hypothetical protein